MSQGAKRTRIGIGLLLVSALVCRTGAEVPPYASGSFVEGVRGTATGFIHMEQVDGRWWAIDPLGRGFYFTGVQSANYGGVQDFLTRRCFYAENNAKRYATRETWRDDCIAKLTSWGFNMLGHGCERELEHRGLVHAHELAMTQCLCRNPKDPDLAICVETTPSCSAFPNVFHPNFERHCVEFARRHCAPSRDDPWVAGWYVDNELAWWGDREARYRPRCNGLYETVVRLPETHSARRALAKFLADRGVAAGAVVPDALKREFLLFAAERYFSVTARAIRAADPNHMLLGARFAGLDGAADPEVFAIAARYSDVLTFNCYPWADLDTNEVLVRADGEPIVKAFGELHARARKPLLVTEWSFPALDAGLPCSGGAGQRFATQDLRAQASELWMRTLLALPYVVGWNYFRWVDQPASGIARHNREDTNYGLVNERNEPYPLLVEAFTRLQRNVLKYRTMGLPRKRMPAAGGEDPRRLLDAFQTPASVSFMRVGDAFSVDVGRGLVLSGRIGDEALLRSIRLGRRELGSYGALLSYDTAPARHVWTATRRTTAATWRDLPGGRGELTLRGEAESDGVKFALTHRLTFVPGSDKFLCECLRLENLGARPLLLDRVYFRLYPAFAVTVPENAVSTPPMWKIPHQAAWTSAKGMLLGAMTTAENVGVFRFYTDERGERHPDMGFYPGPARTLAPGKAWTPPSPMWIVVTAAATTATATSPEPLFTPEQVKAIADDWDAKLNRKVIVVTKTAAPAVAPVKAEHVKSYAPLLERVRKTVGREVESDDFLSWEMVNGRALASRGSTRRDWLTQPIWGELGTATVTRVEFVKKNPHRLRLVWSTGLTLFVNRGTNDWACVTGDNGLGTVVLPKFGFVAFNAVTDRYAAVRRRGKQVVEESAFGDGRTVVRYVNPRGAEVDFGWIRTREAFRLTTKPGQKDCKEMIKR